MIRSEYPDDMALVPTCTGVRTASTAPPSSKPGEDVLESRRVLLIETREAVRIYVEHGRELPGAVDYGKHDLRPGARIAGDVAGKPLHIGHDYGATLGRRRSAHAFAERDFEAAEGPLIGPDAQELGTDDAVKTSPLKAEC